MALVVKKMDSLLAISTFVLAGFGLVMVYSASVIVSLLQYGDPKYYFYRQLVALGLGVGALIFAFYQPYQIWEQLSKWMLPLVLLLLCSVFVLSKGDINGAQRWISVAGQSFQPSEIAKFCLIVYFAAWFSKRQAVMASFTQTCWPFVGVMAVVGGLMLMEPDFGTLSVMGVSAMAIYIVAGMNWKQFLAIAALVALAGAAIMSTPYRRNRVEAFLNPESDTSGVAYHVQNISIAIGSGGWLGLGFGNSAQKRLFLPEPHNDSIFAVIVEELGFVGGTLFVGMLFFMLYRSFRVALRAPDMFGKLLATGIASWFAYQSFLNLLAMTQIIPLKGVPIPFISYGGTNLLVTMFAMGVLLNISKYGQDPADQNLGQKPKRASVRRAG